MKLLCLILTLCFLAHAQQPASSLENYAAVTGMSQFEGVMYTMPTDVIFPLHGPPVRLTVPKGIFLFAQDGRTGYGLVEGGHRLERVDLLSGDTTLISVAWPNPRVLGLGISPKQDLIVLLVEESVRGKCQLYALAQPGQTVRRIQSNRRCPISLETLSISPYNKTVALEAEREIELVDLSDGSAKRIGSYDHATWSPDGQWLAAFKGHSISLLDPVRFRRKKSFGRFLDEDPVWSPDSRYLLVEAPSCGPYFSSMSAIDVYSGKRTDIKSAHCLVMNNGHWFVTQEVYNAQSRKR